MAAMRIHRSNLFASLLLACTASYAAPASDIVSPAHNSNQRTPLRITGTAQATNPLDRVELCIRNNQGHYWNGTSFQSAWARVTATLTGESGSTIWTLGVSIKI